MIFNLSGGRGEAPGTARHAASPSTGRQGRRPGEGAPSPSTPFALYALRRTEAVQGATPFALYALRRTEAVQGAKGGAHPRCTRPWRSVETEGETEGVRAVSWRGGEVCFAPTSSGRPGSLRGYPIGAIILPCSSRLSSVRPLTKSSLETLPSTDLFDCLQPNAA